MSDLKGGTWYMQRGDKVEGPFAAGLISRHILLGRLEMNHKVSEDGQNWYLVKDVPSLIPDILHADRDDPVQQERLMAARRWADERLGEDRREDQLDKQSQDRRSIDRRDNEVDDITLHRSLLGGRKAKAESKSIFFAKLFLITIIISVIWAGYFAYYNKPDEIIVDCNAAPSYAVNWSNCVLLNKQIRSANLEKALLRNTQLVAANMQATNLRGADMAYIDLSGSNLLGADMSAASLKGANLVNVNMQKAVLVNADLSFANLTGANLDSADLRGANLSKAIWIDGSMCAAGAVGGCQK